jgi:hypothetical protein
MKTTKVVVRKINGIELKGFLRPKLRRFHWPTQLKYIYDEFMNCVTHENK